MVRKPGSNGYSPDRNSWAILTAVKNMLTTVAENNPNHTGLAQAREMLSNAQASDYWYWDGTEIWDSNPALGGNLALDPINGAWNISNETTAPTIFIPQRDAYNPGGFMWEMAQSSEITVWTYAFDASGLARVELNYRVDEDGIVADANQVYSDGSGVSAWSAVPMTERNEPASQTDPLPKFRANRFDATLTDFKDKLIDYYVEAEDTKGNIKRSPIRSVYIGTSSSSGGGGSTGSTSLSWIPENPTINDTIFITLKSKIDARLHWGVNPEGSNWQTPATEYRPEESFLFQSGPAIQTPFPDSNAAGERILKIGPFNGTQAVTSLAFVINYENDTWDNNGGNDYKITVSGSTVGGGDGETGYIEPTLSYSIDGNLDGTSKIIAENDGLTLRADWNGRDLYVATEAAQGLGNDVFIFITDQKTGSRPSPWAKAGTILNWSAYIANESDNTYASWYDAPGTKSVNAGTILEGSWDLSAQFTKKPDTLYLSVVRFGNGDNGKINKQAPSANGVVDDNVTFDEFAVITLDSPTLTSKESEADLPEQISIRNYPNPFNPATMIWFTLPIQSFITLEVYDVFGRKISELRKGQFTSGEHAVYFNASNLASGLYFARLQTPNQLLTQKMMLIK